MKERMWFEGEIFYILKLLGELCPLAMDLGRKPHISSKTLGKIEQREEL